MRAERRAVRLFACWRDDPGACRFAFDLVLTGARIDGSWPIFGATDLDAPARRPFVLDADGSLDFAPSDRKWRTDLRSCALRVGAVFTVWWTPEDPAAYEVVKIAELGSKLPSRRQSGGS